MIYIVLMILLAALCAAGFFALPEALHAALDDPMRNEAARARSDRARNMMVRGGFVALFVVVGGLFTAVRALKVVEAGHVGLVYRFGDIVGQRDAGLSLIWPWESFKTADIRIQKVRAESTCSNGFEECIEAFSAETQDVFVQATLNISVNPDDVQTLYRTVGPDYLDKVVRPRLLQTFKDQTVQYRSIEIAPNREKIRAAIRQAMIGELSQYSITVNDMLIDNIDFREEFKLSIEAKQIASQEALRQQELVAASEATARQKAAEALGNADKLRIEAQGQADANRLINESLTPLLIQFQALQKLSDNIQIALIPSGQGLIIDPATLLTQQPPVQ
jgi:regulator of protease activity HflC (stomatin/prohibitin superfamily)